MVLASPTGHRSAAHLVSSYLRLICSSLLRNVKGKHVGVLSLVPQHPTLGALWVFTHTCNTFFAYNKLAGS